ncbi:MAG: deoxyribose-phosphate aldolase [Salinivirgaceae bacterium]|nr:deoxyribose-phosphate aldolase [Salinivirgaceae bacterium]MDD4746045.1 deoxyribose-phosphate aldolase [Salinivirgaceae bacterium]MDY0279317.1 deoxyribose-phosphate aldolase [Salinivirgaceae bacterium]
MKALEKYNLHVNEQEVNNAVEAIIEKSKKMKSLDTLKLLFSLIDLTSLNGSDTKSKIADMATKVSYFQKTFPDMPNVAAICVYPALVPVVKKNLTIDGVGIAAVGAGFPASQTFFDIKTLECKRAVVEGATEVDTVISVGEFFEENYDYIFREIDAQKDSIEDAHLKVILESGSLRSMSEIRIASLIALEAGTDFIKTSTGKTEPAATPQAVYIMCQAIKDYMKTNNRKAGIKPAGGISTSDDALIYYAIVKEVLGDEWLNNKWFRLGASRLANNLLSEIATIASGKDTTVNYF